MEVLACPHCDRLFQVTPVALGKKIRCRGCRGIFHVPHDTTSVPLGPIGPQESLSGLDESLPPLAIPCVIDGQDARSCPQCGRTFWMKESFAGKTIRCRGCKVTFRVRATEPAIAERAQPKATPIQSNGAAAPPRPLQPPSPSVAPPPQPVLPPTIFEDMGDLLDDLLPGEQVPSVVRPRRIPTLSVTQSNPAITMIAIVFGGACALPATLIILRFVSKKSFDDVASVLPDFLVGWLR